MDRRSGSLPGPASWRMDTFPEDLSRGASVLVACAGDPARYAVDLQVLWEYGDGADTAFVVTTTRSVDTTLETYGRLGPAAKRPALRLVDTTARHPSVSELYGDASTIAIPSPGDLERMVIALSDLSESAAPGGARHLVIRSLTPILEETPVERVGTVLERVTGLRADGGLCLLGIDYTAHDGGTIDGLAERLDGILWVTETGSDRLEFQYRPTQGRHHRQLSSPPE